MNDPRLRTVRQRSANPRRWRVVAAAVAVTFGGTAILAGEGAASAATALGIPTQSPAAVLSTGTALYAPVTWSGGTGANYVELSASGLPSGATFSDSADAGTGCSQESGAGAVSFTHASVSTSAVALNTYTFTLKATEYSNASCTTPTGLSASGVASLVVAFSPTLTLAAPGSDTPNGPIAPGALGATLASASTSPGATGTITWSVFGPQASAPTTCTSGGSTIGTATVSGNGAYSPSAGSTPSAAGDYWWYATYTGDSHNISASSPCGSAMPETVVGQSNAVSWATPAPITYGTPLGAAQLDATDAAAGTFLYTPAAGTVLGAGTASLSVVFTPTDTTQPPVSQTVNVLVNPAPLRIAASSSTMREKTTPPPVTPSYSGFVNGDTTASLTTAPICTTSVTTLTPVGTILGANTCTGAADPNYAISYVAGNTTVTVADPAPGYLITTSSGTLYAYGQASASSSVATNPRVRPVVAVVAASPGYYLVTSLGNVYNEGGAAFYGSAARVHLTAAVSAFALTPDGKGYWLATKNGTVYAYGDAAVYGSLSVKAAVRPVVAIASSPDGKGYDLVTSLGNVYNKGDAAFFGSKASVRLPHPIVAFATTSDGKGYDLVSSGGNIWNFGDARFFGSKASTKLASPITSFALTLDGAGYYLLASNGQLYPYADAASYGSPTLSGAAAVTSMAVAS